MSTRVSFSVDVHLLAELGERLVGKPAIAVGELVKNSYDADATYSEIRFDPDEIVILDDGHGMTEKTLRSGYLRVGTASKRAATFSPGGRRMTGSKGVGRLATQMLGRTLVVETRAPSTSAKSPFGELFRLEVDWSDKTEGQDLTTFAATLERPSDAEYLDGFGTAIVIRDLSQTWTPKHMEDMAREVWTLQSPFQEPTGDDVFKIRFVSPDESLEGAFERVLAGWFDLHEAEIVGNFHQTHSATEDHQGATASGPHVHLELRMIDRGSIVRETVALSNPALGSADYKIRIYSLKGRQPLGIRVNEIRKYLNSFGGVYLYDDGFRLPYYGPETDWLRIEMDHSHRRIKSRILPDELRGPGGLSFLPTMSRIFGAVNVSTSSERGRVLAGEVDERDSLQIQISRDRLLDTKAFDTLRRAVRAGVDLYAYERSRLAVLDAEERLDSSRKGIENGATSLEILEIARTEIADDTYATLRGAMVVEQEVHEATTDLHKRRAAAMGALATAGMVALLVEHEQARLLPQLEGFLARTSESKNRAVREVREDIRRFVDQVAAIRPLLQSPLDLEDRDRVSLRVFMVVQHVVRTMKSLLSGIDVAIDVPKDVYFPEASLAEWTALFQNVLLNSANAVLGATSPRIEFRWDAERRVLQVLDNGSGIDLGLAPSLFEPFARGDVSVPPERRALGLGGSGLGLTIVRTIAESAGVTVGFADPPSGWSTVFTMEW